MSRSRIYLDNNATTEPLKEVCSVMYESLRSSWANPSSGYSSADGVRQLIRRERASAAGLVGASEEQLIFTSGGTESNNLAILSALSNSDPSRKKFVSTSIEHASVMAMFPCLEELGYQVVVVDALRSGLVDIDSLCDEIDEGAALVSLQWVNNETGVIQDIAAVSSACRAAGSLLHLDAAQAVGKMPVDFSELGADFITFTAHKLHGPKGVGAVVSRMFGGSPVLLRGGTQEFGLRPGTENVTGIVGFGEACRLRESRLPEVTKHTMRLRKSFEGELREIIPELEINGGGAPRIGNTSNILFPGVDGRAIVNQLDLLGVECSQSSACTQARPEPSHVLTAMGLSEDEAYASIRFSFSELNNQDEVRDAVAAICTIYERIKKASVMLAG